jgi:hypothetical protein
MLQGKIPKSTINRDSLMTAHPNPDAIGAFVKLPPSDAQSKELV